jgi:hypothetical protein
MSPVSPFVPVMNKRSKTARGLYSGLFFALGPLCETVARESCGPLGVAGVTPISSDLNGASFETRSATI